jgi:uncharacterized protein YndB with AHSA1/START domain
METIPETGQKQSVVHNTFVLERSFSQPPQSVFAAFADPAKKRRWFADETQHEVEKFEAEFRVGGFERVSYRMKPGTPIAGKTISSMGCYLDIVENRRIVSASTMALDEKPISAALVTIELLPSGGGTNLICTHQGAFFQGADGPAMREAGWRALIEKLARALESE